MLTQTELSDVSKTYFDRMVQQMGRCVQLRTKNLPYVEGLAHMHLDALRSAMELASSGKIPDCGLRALEVDLTSYHKQYRVLNDLQGEALELDIGLELTGHDLLRYFSNGPRFARAVCKAFKIVFSRGNNGTT